MKQNNRNPWDILGVSKDASQQQIREAFRRLALKYHPDKSGTTEQFRLINTAYNKLKNKQMVPIIESPSTKMINLKLDINQQINGIDDYVEVEKDLFIHVKIPAGSINGDKYRLTENGQQFIINVQEKVHPLYKRQGLSLMGLCSIDIITAMTGGKRAIEGPCGDELIVDIPSGINNNAIIKIDEQGLFNRRTNKRGNLLLSVELQIPKLDSQELIDDFINRLSDVRN
jgi:DnaJ-class molecular chaperone